MGSGEAGVSRETHPFVGVGYGDVAPIPHVGTGYEPQMSGGQVYGSPMQAGDPVNPYAGAPTPVSGSAPVPSQGTGPAAPAFSAGTEDKAAATDEHVSRETPRRCFLTGDHVLSKRRPFRRSNVDKRFDVIVTTTNSPALGELITNGWLTPLDQSMMSNFRAYASRLAENPPWDPGNVYTMTWQSGWTAVGYNSKVIPNPGTSLGILFNKKYAGRVGMLADPQELGSLGMLAIGVEPATSTEADWRRAAAFLQKQKATTTNYFLDDEKGEWSDRWVIKSIPAVLVYGKDGKQAAKLTNDDPDKQFTYEKDVEPLVRRLLKGK